MMGIWQMRRPPEGAQVSPMQQSLVVVQSDPSGTQ